MSTGRLPGGSDAKTTWNRSLSSRLRQWLIVLFAQVSKWTGDLLRRRTSLLVGLVGHVGQPLSLCHVRSDLAAEEKLK